ncbi:MAG: AbrB/MazE/SpoVT family DNA-binding domain-containing protein [Anaerolineaceae bacterium]|jgi:bifunctional DNA-binding transcriptional regulator/antitoxin component of YhaV-PrlF toxin-antitoxin module
MSDNIIQVRKKGSITLPVEIRTKYGYNEGDVFTLIDLGDGSFILSPRVLYVNQLGDRIANIIKEKQLSEDELLKALDEEREDYYRDHYAGH